ncbi:Ulp1 protease family C-terminal catalytic domain [Arabidopsis suecica]|uniref:Ulp1 protease family C-terminal catalytic domain n=1 Tax=Arabidopsis suecica TaxID=45249 RepID=A0A8T2G0L0_ARASU|nr:Ulp1 protease family C-terminal catalytic domain [Arabidopsis suecica]
MEREEGKEEKVPKEENVEEHDEHDETEDQEAYVILSDDEDNGTAPTEKESQPQKEETTEVPKEENVEEHDEHDETEDQEAYVILSDDEDNGTAPTEKESQPQKEETTEVPRETKKDDEDVNQTPLSTQEEEITQRQSSHHAEMAEDLQGFLSYPWGRLSFEMMMTSIKEREVEQLATTCVAVQGLLYALQLVVLEAVPAIEEGPQIDEVVLSDSDAEAAADVATRPGVALKLGNAKNVDSNCEAHVEPIIFPNARLNPAEDLTWSDDEDDERVDNMRGGKTKVVRGRKAQSNARLATGMRRKNHVPIREKGESSSGVYFGALSRMIDEKLKAQSEKILKGVIHWFTKNLVVDPDNPKADKEAADGDHGPHADKEVASGDNGLQADKETGGEEQNSNPVSSPESANEYEESDFNPIPPPRQPSPMQTDFTLPSFQGDQAISAVDDVVSFYNSVDVPTDPSGGASNTNKTNKVQADVDMVDDLNAGRAHQADVEMVDDINAAMVEQDLNMPSDGVAHPSSSTVSPPKSVTTENTALGPDVAPDPLNPVAPLDPLPSVVVVATSVVAPNPPKESQDFVMFSSQIGSSQPTHPSALPTQALKTASSPITKLNDTPKVDNVSSVGASLIPNPPVTIVQRFFNPPQPSGGKLLAGKDGGGPDGDVNQGRKSKRPRTLSSKLDGRFHFDKKTKLLVGHPSPFLSIGELASDPEVRYQRSLSKIKGKSSISTVGEASLPHKEIFDIIERKKHFSSKVMDVLIKFSRHLLRTDDIDGEKLRVDVLGSKFVSQLTRLFPKFAKTLPPEDFIFPSALVDLLIGAGESDRVRLFAEADCVYMPFNFDKKHWVSLCVDLKAHKITILDSNIQLRRDAALYAELQPLAAMLPYLFR